MLPTRPQLAALAALVVVAAVAVALWVRGNHARAEAETAWAEVERVAAVNEALTGDIAALREYERVLLAEAELARARAAEAEARYAEATSAVAVRRVARERAAETYRVAVGVYDTTGANCPAALGACRAYAASLEGEVAASEAALAVADTVIAARREQVSALTEAVAVARERGDASERGRLDLLAALAAYRPPAPRTVYVGPALAFESASGGRLGVAVGVPGSVRVPVIGTVDLLGVGTWVPGQVTLGVGVGL